MTVRDLQNNFSKVEIWLGEGEATASRTTPLVPTLFNEDLEEPLPVSIFLLLEFRQSVRFQARLFEKERTQGDFKTEGELCRDVPAPWFSDPADFPAGS